MAKLLGTEQFSPSDKTFIELQTGKYPWWDNLKKNKNISIQVRKKNTIDVYYNGGAILKDLKFDDQKKGFTANVHPKYIPLEDDTHYQSLALDSNGVKFTGKIDPQALSQFEGAKLKAVINRVKKYFDAESEKSIQYKFAINDPYVIDTEFQFGKDLRIDLVRLDVGIKKIVFIEIKTMGDPRLFAPIEPGEENIHDQLKKYKDFAGNYSEGILDYYRKVLQVKNDLGITKQEIRKLVLTDWQVECRPLLAFGDCEQAWINRNSAEIDKKIKTIACGAYYFGLPDYPLDLVLKSQKNRHIF